MSCRLSFSHKAKSMVLQCLVDVVQGRSSCVHGFVHMVSPSNAASFNAMHSSYITKSENSCSHPF
jgi:hypothetical protein